MKSSELKDHLKILTQLTGPPGHEGEVRNYVRETWTNLVNEFQVDGLGSLTGIKYGTGPKPRRRIMLSAHMDEIGLMVCGIKDGYLRVNAVGGIDSRITLSKTVVIYTRERSLQGVFATPPPHITRQTGATKNYPKLQEQWIDLGLPANDVEKLVQVGDIAVIDGPMIELSNDLVAAKAMDDRASVAAVTTCLDYLQTRTHVWDVYAVASVQEEVGVKGATTAAYQVKPDLAIAIDVGFAQQPGVSGDAHVKLGDGPQIGIGPNFHDGLLKSLRDTASKLELPLHIEPTPGNSGTDAWAIQISHAGVPTALFSIPIRNMHSPIETVSIKDIDRTGRIMAEFIADLTEDYLETITWKPDNGEDEE